MQEEQGLRYWEGKDSGSCLALSLSSHLTQEESGRRKVGLGYHMSMMRGTLGQPWVMCRSQILPGPGPQVWRQGAHRRKRIEQWE